jgi:pyruvate kinase
LRPHKTCALMVETRGREVRISAFESPTQRIRSGSTVSLLIDEFNSASNESQLRINSSVIQRFLKPNDVIYFDDGKVVGIVIEVSAKEVKMEIKIGGTIKSSCNVRFTGGKHSNLELVTKEDVEDIATISQLTMIDFLAIPFCNSGADPMTVRELLGPEGKNIKVISKIDTLEGVQQFDNIMTQGDGCIFVRNEI